MNHDPDRFYHCHCLDEGDEHDPERFYHCTCIEDGWTEYEDDDGDME